MTIADAGRAVRGDRFGDEPGGTGADFEARIQGEFLYAASPETWQAKHRTPWEAAEAANHRAAQGTVDRAAEVVASIVPWDVLVGREHAAEVGRW